MHSISLPEICDRAAAKALYSELCEVIGPAQLAVDASAVKKVGLAVLQTLVAASRSDGGIVIEKPSERFREAVRIAGLEQVLVVEGQS